jgi:hypothetical protein
VHLSKALDIAAEVIGFVSSAALAQQAYRLVSHQQTAKELRDTADFQSRSAPSLAERAQKSARALDDLIGHWDKVDQRLVFVGVLGLVISFALKLLSMFSE